MEKRYYKVTYQPVFNTYTCNVLATDEEDAIRVARLFLKDRAKMEFRIVNVEGGADQYV